MIQETYEQVKQRHDLARATSKLNYERQRQAHKGTTATQEPAYSAMIKRHQAENCACFDMARFERLYEIEGEERRICVRWWLCDDEPHVTLYQNWPDTGAPITQSGVPAPGWGPSMSLATACELEALRQVRVAVDLWKRGILGYMPDSGPMPDWPVAQA